MSKHHTPEQKARHAATKAAKRRALNPDLPVYIPKTKRAPKVTVEHATRTITAPPAAPPAAYVVKQTAYNMHLPHDEARALGIGVGEYDEEARKRRNIAKRTRRARRGK